MALDFPTGWRRDEEDTDYLRNRGIPFAPPKLFGVPDVFDTRPIINVENQGQTSSCVGHGSSSCIEACAWIAGQGQPDTAPEQFSRWFAYIVAQEQSNLAGRDRGATITGAAEAMKKSGCCLETSLPFTGRYFSNLPGATRTEASKFKIRSHTSLQNYQQVFDFIAGGFGGVIIGITWTGGLASSNGIIERNDAKGNGGGHCVLLWGWSKRVDSQGRKYIWLHNSHSKAWGNLGRAEVAPDVIDFWGSQGDNEMIGFSDLSGFDQPRRIVPTIDQVM